MRPIEQQPVVFGIAGKRVVVVVAFKFTGYAVAVKGKMVKIIVGVAQAFIVCMRFGIDEYGANAAAIVWREAYRWRNKTNDRNVSQGNIHNPIVINRRLIKVKERGRVRRTSC